MNNITAAFYARVSSDHQAKNNTIDSQIQALLNRIEQDNLLIEKELQFIDDGYSGSTIIRPALEKLRDEAYLGRFNRLYVLNPSRLARNYAYQFLLIDELKKSGVEVVFLNYNFKDNPEEQMLLQIQGIVAEYERAKIMERSRRGKIYLAKKGSVSVLSNAPYGYKYISKRQGAEEACFEVIIEEAIVVKDIFNWVIFDRCSLGKVCKKLHEKGIKTRKGNEYWNRSVIKKILNNPAYKGLAAYGRTYAGDMLPRLRPRKGRSLHPRNAFSTYQKSQDEWIYIPVPPIVDEKLFDAAQEIMLENKKRLRESLRGATYLLQGLIKCSICGYSFYGRNQKNPAANGKFIKYQYYKCMGSDYTRFSNGKRICSNIQVRVDMLDDAIWKDVSNLLSNKERLEEEFKRRLTGLNNGVKSNRINQLQAGIKRIKSGINRLIDSYEDGLIDKNDFEPRIRNAKEKSNRLQKELNNQLSYEDELKNIELVIGKLKDFTDIVEKGLEDADWMKKREIIRAIIKEINIGKENVEIVYKISPDLIKKKLISKNVQHCCKSYSPEYVVPERDAKCRL